MTQKRTLSAVLLALAATTATARAEQPATPPAANAAPSPDAVAEARQHYERGMTHYQLGEFTAAVGEFKQAYALSPAPGLLFNLAQASRLAKQYEQALYFYRTYLRVAPEAPNRTDVETRIAELERQVKEDEARRAADAEARRAAAATPRTVIVREAPPRPSGKALKLSGIVVGAVGLAGLGAGIGLGVAANNEQSSLNKLASSMGIWSSAQTNDYNRGRTEAAAATALYVVGGVAAGTGVILYMVGWSRDRAAHFAFAPAPGGGALALGTWSF
jgi:tetratricopeptide (TPR) repeat protein